MATKSPQPIQIKKIHTLKNALSMGEEIYRATLDQRFGVASSKDLNFSQAQELIDDLEEKAVAVGAWEKRPRKQRYGGTKQRKGMATDKQIGLIQRMWTDVSKAESDEGREKGLRGFLLRTAKVSDLRFLDSRGASQMILALKKMGGKA